MSLGRAHSLVVKGDIAEMKCHRDCNKPLRQEQWVESDMINFIEDVEGKGCGKDSGLSSHRKQCEVAKVTCSQAEGAG